MKCISLWQSWASLCVLASPADKTTPVKPYETRHWRTDFRGRLLIHAAKKWSRELHDTACSEPFMRCLLAGGLPDCDAMPLGRIVGAVDLVDVYQVQTWIDKGRRFTGLTRMLDRPFQDSVNAIALPTGDALAFGDFSLGRYAWALRNPVMFKTPIPYKGAQGFFNVPDEVVAAEMARAVAA